MIELFICISICINSVDTIKMPIEKSMNGCLPKKDWDSFIDRTRSLPQWSNYKGKRFEKETKNGTVLAMERQWEEQIQKPVK